MNYLSGEHLFTKVCRDGNHPIQCFPPQFEGSFDRVLHATGDGTFRDVSKDSGVEIADGKGMGLVAADFDNSGKLSLFIANDTTPNFFLSNRGFGPPQFENIAALSGLALSKSGKAASAMGIAIGDANGDQQLDLFVTNFQDEANNLYLRVDTLLFDDQIKQFHLHDDGFAVEGWGAQFSDCDLDGDQDLIVANGHLDDYPHTLGQRRMPTQIFVNDQNKLFRLEDSKKLGRYFGERYLGRAVAKLDANQDGKTDFVVTHLHDNPAMLINETVQTGNFVAIRLVGRASSRDAIGAEVRLSIGSLNWTQQLTGGDGFQASNEKLLTFGVGDAVGEGQVSIRWPSGQTDRHSMPLINRRYTYVESSGPDLDLGADE
ncbi:MAG: CRTAC1 family protein [Pirellulaceae bacterium]